MLSPVILFKSLTTLGTRTERDTERRGARGEMEKEDGGGDELSGGGRQSGLKSTEKKEVIRKEAKRERERKRVEVGVWVSRPARQLEQAAPSLLRSLSGCV